MYLTSCLFFISRLIIQTIVLVLLILRFKTEHIEGLRIVKNEKYNIPFSFFNIVFIHNEISRSYELKEILAHEKVHIRGLHWFDLLIIELLTVIFWFNPFIWLFEHAIKQNHEYLADKGVLAQGHNAGRYQALLLNQLAGVQILGIANNLNFAINSNRFKMMTKMKTPKIKKVKFAWSLPILALLFFAFAEPEYKINVVENAINQPILAEQTEGKEQIIYGKVLKEKSKEPLYGASVVIRGTTIGTVSDQEGNFKLINPSPKTDPATGGSYTELVISFVGYESEVAIIGQKEDNSTVRHNFVLKKGIVSIDTEKIINLKQPPPPPPIPHPAEQPSSGKQGEKIFFIVEEMPEYPGGLYALGQYIKENRNKVARDQKLTGKSLIGFTINPEGKVTDVKIMESDSEPVGEQAAKIVMNMADWEPGTQRGVAVPVDFVIQLAFQ
jgi:TonB family protein